MRNKPKLSAVAEMIPEATDLQEIGSGGFKIVYSARVHGNIEAVKIVKIPNDTDDIRDENLGRIRREIKIIRACSSPFLVNLGSIQPRDVEIANDSFYVYSEEFISGKSLREKIQANHRPELAELIELTGCGLAAINEFKDMGVIHRDIKPDNIMATGLSERPYVMLDFGIAFQQGGTPLTMDSAHIPGTLYYIAPEMLDFNFRQNLDYRADLYALGLTVYEYATGVNPFWKTEGSQFDTLYRIKTVNPERLQDLRTDLPDIFCSMINQLIKKIPALRPANISALIKKVEGLK